MSSECEREIEMLKEFYGITEPETVPEEQCYHEWIAENKFGFLLGVLRYGEDEHREELKEALTVSTFKQIEKYLIDRLYSIYIHPFDKDGRTNQTPIKSHPGTPLITDARNEDNEGFVPVTSSNQSTFRQALIERDSFLDIKYSFRKHACLFCWDSDSVQAAHIIAQKATPYIANALAQANVQLNSPQNGLSLCIRCHNVFDQLKKYVEFNGDRILLKVVNDPFQENHDRDRRIKDLAMRNVSNFYGLPVTEEDGEIVVYIPSEDVTLYPSHAALELHRRACLIWRMAGGGHLYSELEKDLNN